MSHDGNPGLQWISPETYSSVAGRLMEVKLPESLGEQLRSMRPSRIHDLVLTVRLAEQEELDTTKGEIFKIIATFGNQILVCAVSGPTRSQRRTIPARVMFSLFSRPFEEPYAMWTLSQVASGEENEGTLTAFRHNLADAGAPGSWVGEYLQHSDSALDLIIRLAVRTHPRWPGAPMLVDDIVSRIIRAEESPRQNL